MSEIDWPIYDSYQQRRIAGAIIHQTREIDELEQSIVTIRRYGLRGV